MRGAEHLITGFPARHGSARQIVVWNNASSRWVVRIPKRGRSTAGWQRGQKLRDTDQWRYHVTRL